MALANTAEIMAAYDAVLANELDWYVVKILALFVAIFSDFDRFLLHYPNVTVRDRCIVFENGIKYSFPLLRPRRTNLHSMHLAPTASRNSKLK